MKVDLLTPDSSRLMFPPGGVIQRGLTKVEGNKEDENRISLDQSQNLQLAVTSLKSFGARPSNVSGSRADSDDDNSVGKGELAKPSLNIEQLDHVSDLGVSQQDKADLKSQMSFKTHDSQTIVTVLSQSKSIFNEAKKADVGAAKPPAVPTSKKTESESKRSIGILSQGSGTMAEKVAKKLLNKQNKPNIVIPAKPQISELKSDNEEELPSGRIMLKSDAPQLGVS